jgi:hypothetical protein
MNSMLIPAKATTDAKAKSMRKSRSSISVSLHTASARPVAVEPVACHSSARWTAYYELSFRSYWARSRCMICIVFAISSVGTVPQCDGVACQPDAGSAWTDTSTRGSSNSAQIMASSSLAVFGSFVIARPLQSNDVHHKQNRPAASRAVLLALSGCLGLGRFSERATNLLKFSPGRDRRLSPRRHMAPGKLRAGP